MGMIATPVFAIFGWEIKRDPMFDSDNRFTVHDYPYDL